MDKRKKSDRKMAWIAGIIFAVVVVTAIYIMRNDLGLIEGMPWGPGAYYYTDIPGWEKIFWEEGHITSHTSYPILFTILFVAWGLLSWKVWQWLDKKL